MYVLANFAISYYPRGHAMSLQTLIKLYNNALANAKGLELERLKVITFSQFMEEISK